MTHTKAQGPQESLRRRIPGPRVRRQRGLQNPLTVCSACYVSPATYTCTCAPCVNTHTHRHVYTHAIHKFMHTHVHMHTNIGAHIHMEL